jgi:integrase
MKYPKPFYRSGRDAWVVQVGGRQLTLAKGRANEAAAWERYHAIMAEQGREPAPTPLAALPVADLKPYHLEAWLEAHRWSDSTRRGAITMVKAALNWCARQGHIPANPLRDVSRPRMARRTRTVAPAERVAIREQFDPAFADFLDAMSWTGARPGEIMRLEAAHIDWEAAYAELHGKTTGKTGEKIGLSLIPSMVALCRRLADRNPTGPLFRNSRGQPWKPNAVRCRMMRMRKKAGISGVNAYTYRHSYVTDALQNGVPIADVAALVNHRDIRTTMGYNHLTDRREHLRRQAAKAAGDDSGSSTPGAGR